MLNNNGGGLDPSTARQYPSQFAAAAQGQAGGNAFGLGGARPPAAAPAPA